MKPEYSAQGKQHSHRELSLRVKCARMAQMGMMKLIL
jgi:hypothetical protein